MDINPYEDRIFYDSLGMRLWERRHQFMDVYVQEGPLLDIGCNEGKFIVRQTHSLDIKLIVGVDIDKAILDEAILNICTDQIQECLKPNRQYPCNVQLYCGDATKKSKELKSMNFQIITLIEVIEHFHQDKLPALCENVFGYLNAQQVIITTPNIEFNIYFKENDPNFKFRHSDHKFEFTRAEFQKWCHDVADQYHYQVRFDGVGAHKSGDMTYGYASQIAIFNKITDSIQEWIVNEEEIQQVLNYQCPFDGRAEYQKLGTYILSNYTSMAIQYSNNLSDQEYDYLDSIDEKDLLIPLKKIRQQEYLKELMVKDQRFTLFKDQNYLLVKLRQQ